jgi:hypothetical protein
VLRGKGICYDAGFVHRGVSSRESLDPAVVGREMRIIRDDLHCTAVRVTGGDPDRLELVAGLAADAGLEVWFSPFTCDLDEIVEWDETTVMPRRLNGDFPRDEGEQVTYLRELLDIFDAEGVDSAFVFTFESTQFPHRPGGDPQDDLDRGAYGIVKMRESGRGETYPDMAWEPKAAFAALADQYGSDL